MEQHTSLSRGVGVVGQNRGGIYKSVPGGSGHNISLSRGAFLYCPGRVGLQLLSSVVGVS